MKYIKKFENINTPEIGDYIICDVDQSRFQDLYEFLKSHIGKVIAIFVSNEPYHVRFDVNREDLEASISNYHKRIYKGKKLTISFHPNEVKYFSKNKKDLELKINSDKYNL